MAGFIVDIGDQSETAAVFLEAGLVETCQFLVRAHGSWSVVKRAAYAAACLLRHEKADFSRGQKAKQYTCERWIYEIGPLGLIEFALPWCARLSVQGLQ